MKYFAKYLPVEGEIKKGDIVKDNYSGNIGEAIRWGTQEEADEYSKVKLFLCSRDIQVGDKVNFKYTVKEITKNEGNNPDEKKLLENGLTHWFSFEDGGLGTNKDTVKVIGEISPEAIWVKERDEFDEDDWKPSFHNTKSIFQNVVKIKGPCGHFH